MALKPLSHLIQTANVEEDTLATPYRFLRLVSVSPATAVVYIRTADPQDNGGPVLFTPTKRLKRIPSAPPLQKLYVKSDTANTQLIFEIGEVDEMVEENVGVVATIAGTVNNNPVGASLMADSLGVLYTLKTADGINLSVGGNTTPLGVFGFGSTIDVDGAAMVRLIVQASGVTGDYMTVKGGQDITAPPIPIYDESGNVIRRDGRIYFDNNFSPVGTVYYLNTSGIGLLSFAVGVGTPVVSVYLEPFEAIPDAIASNFNMDMADLGFTSPVAISASQFSKVLPASGLRRALMYLSYNCAITGSCILTIYPCDKNGTRRSSGSVSLSVVGTGGAKEMILTASAVPGEQWFHNVGVSQGANSVGPPLPSNYIQIGIQNTSAATAMSIAAASFSSSRS